MEPWRDAVEIDLIGSGWSLDEVMSLPPALRADRARLAREYQKARSEERGSMFRAVMDGIKALVKAWS